MSMKPDDATPESPSALEEEETALRAELSTTREARRAAQRELAAAGVLRLAIQRTARDRSSGTTDQVEATRDRAQDLFDEIGDLVGGADDLRAKITQLRQAYPAVPVPPRLLEALATEADWRETINTGARSEQARLHLPVAGELR